MYNAYLSRLVHVASIYYSKIRSKQQAQHPRAAPNLATSDSFSFYTEVRNQWKRKVDQPSVKST
jgi:hypothetical protein